MTVRGARRPGDFMRTSAPSVRSRPKRATRAEFMAMTPRII